MAQKGANISKIAVWTLMAFLMIGLAGFGVTNFSGSIRSIGSVGDKEIPVHDYYRQLQTEMRVIEQRRKARMTFAEAQEAGLDRAVLQRLIRARALDHEISQMGMSVGDAAISDQILNTAAFQGAEGKFNRESYRSMLKRMGISEGEYETSLREETARTLVQGAVVGSLKMPEAYTNVLVEYAAQQRSFTWSLLDGENLTTPLPTPTTEELTKFYDDNQDLFMLPASKTITYVLLSPDDLLDEVEVSEEEIKKAYEDRADTYNVPERRLVERLIFPNEEAAEKAAAALEVNGTTFEALAQERNLELADLDLGDVKKSDLGAAGDEVFAAEEGSVVGPLPTDLGPALFRVNGTLTGQVTTLEDARDELRSELASARAARAVEARADELDDRLAGGETLAMLAEGDAMTMDTIDWTDGSSDGIAAYDGFRKAAAAVKEGDYPRILQLDDGGIFALQLDGEQPLRPAPFESIRDQVTTAWKAEQTTAALTEQAKDLTEKLSGGASFADVGLDAVTEENLQRSSFVENMPASVLVKAFQIKEGEVATAPGADGTLAILRLDAITSATKNDEISGMVDELRLQMNQELARDIFAVFSNDVVMRAGQQIDQQAVNAVHVNLR